jgi:integrase
VGRYVSDDEIERLIQHAPTKNLRFQIQLAAKVGMRLNEILQLSWDRIDLKGAWITLYAEHTKTKRKRFVPIPNDLLPEFKKRFQEKDGIFVFPANGTKSKPVSKHQSAWDTCREKAKVSCRFHDLRHRAITDMLAAGISETDVSKITGASPMIIARVYHHLRTDTLERVRNLSCGKFVGSGTK